jgi:hypothetical protein
MKKLVKESLNESSYSDFLMNYGQEIREALKNLKKMRKVISEITEQDDDKIQEKMRIYDTNVGDEIFDWIHDPNVSADEIAKFALNNQDRWGTEPQFVLFAIDDCALILNKYFDNPKYISNS